MANLHPISDIDNIPFRVSTPSTYKDPGFKFVFERIDRVKLFDSNGCMDIKFSMAVSMEMIMFSGIIVN